MSLSIVIVEDDRSASKALSRFLRKDGFQVATAATGEEGVELFREASPDVVLMDLMLPGINGLETLGRLRALDPTAAVIVMTGHATIETAVEAMQLGALDYLTKPIDLDALILKLKQTGRVIGLQSDLGYVIERERKEAGLESFIGSSPAMRAVYEKIREVAKTDNTTVLVTGESGTGKELVARAIHSLSARGSKPLMQIDCTAIPITLLESELFGHERGAFTGADRTKKGLLELADSGTLLLDEIGDMDLALQAKFLRVLQERQFRRVGSTRDLRFDVRVITATNQDLDRLCDEGRFRRELIFRLKVFQIELPPLRDRGDDILELADTFVEQFARSFRKPIRGFDTAAREKLGSYSYPGNVRELRNIIEQATILARDELIGCDLLSIQR
ncbi:MAG: sigma-54-dependent Fis family transcriptional regulator, partial [Deltaproteobacteria bacterium]|nr:sigma-54-dependent Fis family transcriptional regulator [Deltaproteobacteria bacterium]